MTDLFSGTGTVTRVATISACGAFRYRLARIWDPGAPLLTWVMLNPSVADGEQDDPTIRKCVGFARRLGFGSIEVLNLFAFRATDPWHLKACGYQVGRDNDHELKWAAKRAVQAGQPVVCAWGAHARGLARVAEVFELLRATGADLRALEVMEDCTPRHPLMLAYEVARADGSRGERPLVLFNRVPA